MTAAPFLEAYAHLLVPGGMVHLKTDSDLFYGYTRESVERWGGCIVNASDDMQTTGSILPGAGDVVAMAVGVGDLHQCQLVVGCKGQDIVYGATVDGQRLATSNQEISKIVTAIEELFDFQWPVIRMGLLVEGHGLCIDIDILNCASRQQKKRFPPLVSQCSGPCLPVCDRLDFHSTLLHLFDECGNLCLTFKNY